MTDQGPQDPREDFETAARALSGWKEAILQRLDALKASKGIDMQYRVVFTDLDGNRSESADPRGEPATFKMPLADYFLGTPKRFHDVDRYRVQPTVYLEFPPGTGHHDLRVIEVATASLVWTA